jgi:Ca2+-binding RTX toxin-like protein
MSNQATDAGSKFFVIGTYVQPDFLMDQWKGLGINTMVATPDGSNVDTWSQTAASKGLYMIRQPGSNLTADANNPYLLAWATSDEPSNTSSTLDYGVVNQDPAEVQQQANPLRAAAAAAGKDIPIWTNHVGGHIYPSWAANNALMKDYMEGPESDWLAHDSYPIQSGQPLLVNATDAGENYVSTQQGVNTFRQETWSGGKATMAFIGSSAYEAGQPVPTAGEMKAQAWSAIINGAEGVIYFPVAFTPGWNWNATPAHLQTAMKELHADIKALDDILMNEQTGGRAPYKVYHSAQQGVTPTAGQLPYGFEAAEITTEDGGTYRIILNITGQERTLNKPEWDLNNVSFGAYGVQKGPAPGTTPTDPTPVPTPEPTPTDPTPVPTPEPTPTPPTGVTYTKVGTSSSETLTGTSGADAINGMGGSDKLWGKASNDILTGGSGKDYFIFDTTLSATRNVDRITDFYVADDSIQLNDSIFAKVWDEGQLRSSWFRVGEKALDSNDYIVYNKSTGALYYDKDGSGSAAAVKFAVVENKALLTAADFIVI